MQTFKHLAINLIEPSPIPDVPESCGPRNEEDARVLSLVLEGMSSGQALPVDDAFFADLDDLIP